jgi:uncharacterized protein (DUF983 family)
MPWDVQLGRAARIVRRALRLCCPRCGETPLFPRHGAWPNWFRMERRCAFCGLTFERAQGYFVGAIYINYGVTTVLVLTGYFILWGKTELSTAAQFAIWVPVLLVFPLWFFRYSRSLWLALEYSVNP